MTHSITPPPELTQQWMSEFYGTPIVPGEACTDLAARAAQWGADQELEACCEWIAAYPWLDHPELLIKQLRAARRPKPPSLKEQALRDLADIEANYGHLTRPEMLLQSRRADTIRRALEALPE